MLVGWWSSRKVHDMTDFPAAGPGIWVPLGDDSVPPELERAARNDKLMPQPILGATL